MGGYFSANAMEYGDSDLSWNALGIFYEDLFSSKSVTGHHIEYTLPKRVIWLRRTNLKGAEIRVGYIDSYPYLYAKVNDTSGRGLTQGHEVQLFNSK